MAGDSLEQLYAHYHNDAGDVIVIGAYYSSLAKEWLPPYLPDIFDAEKACRDSSYRTQYLLKKISHSKSR